MIDFIPFGDYFFAKIYRLRKKELRIISTPFGLDVILLGGSCQQLPAEEASDGSSDCTDDATCYPACGTEE